MTYEVKRWANMCSENSYSHFFFRSKHFIGLKEVLLKPVTNGFYFKSSLSIFLIYF